MSVADGVEPCPKFDGEVCASKGPARAVRDFDEIVGAVKLEGTGDDAGREGGAVAQKGELRIDDVECVVLGGPPGDEVWWGNGTQEFCLAEADVVDRDVIVEVTQVQG